MERLGIIVVTGFVPVDGHRGVLECLTYGTEGAIFDYALGAGKKASPVEQARRAFSKSLEEGDTVELAEGLGGSRLRAVRGSGRAGGGPPLLGLQRPRHRGELRITRRSWTPENVTPSTSLAE